MKYYYKQEVEKTLLAEFCKPRNDTRSRKATRNNTTKTVTHPEVAQKQASKFRRTLTVSFSPHAQNTEVKKRLFSQEMRDSNHDNNPTTTTASIYCKTSIKSSTSIKQCTRQLVYSPQATNQTRESPQTHNPPTDPQKTKPQTTTTTTTERQEELNKTLRQRQNLATTYPCALARLKRHHGHGHKNNTFQRLEREANRRTGREKVQV
jgi:hypothetical protein